MLELPARHPRHNVIIEARHKFDDSLWDIKERYNGAQLLDALNLVPMLEVTDKPYYYKQIRQMFETACEGLTEWEKVWVKSTIMREVAKFQVAAERFGTKEDSDVNISNVLRGD